MTSSVAKDLVESLHCSCTNKDIYTALGISKTTFYRWLNQKDIPCDDVSFVKETCIKHAFRYGYRKVTALMHQQGFHIHHKKVLCIMKENNLLAKVRRKKNKYHAGSEGIVAPNIIKRHFKANAPNQKWFTDITYILFGECPLYLSVIMDGFNGEIVSSKISRAQDVSLVINTLKGALPCVQDEEVILHSDQGSVYKSKEFQKYVTENSITMSMSRKGNCYDNAAMESFFSSLKTEVFYSQNIKVLNTK